MTVQRYNFHTEIDQRDGASFFCMAATSDGDWVAHDDYTALLQENKKVREDRNDLLAKWEVKDIEVVRLEARCADLEQQLEDAKQQRYNALDDAGEMMTHLWGEKERCADLEAAIKSQGAATDAHEDEIERLMDVEAALKKRLEEAKATIAELTAPDGWRQDMVREKEALQAEIERLRTHNNELARRRLEMEAAVKKSIVRAEYAEATIERMKREKPGRALDVLRIRELEDKLELLREALAIMAKALYAVQPTLQQINVLDGMMSLEDAEKQAWDIVANAARDTLEVVEAALSLPADLAQLEEDSL